MGNVIVVGEQIDVGEVLRLARGRITKEVQEVQRELNDALGRESAARSDVQVLLSRQRQLAKETAALDLFFARATTDSFGWTMAG